jgi:hypothetical protein
MVARLASVVTCKTTASRKPLIYRNMPPHWPGTEHGVVSKSKRNPVACSAIQRKGPAGDVAAPAGSPRATLNINRTMSFILAPGSGSVRQIICVRGYTKVVRPSSRFTNEVKAKLMRESGLAESLMSAYELDHIVPLALGGHPRKLANLTLQPWGGEHGAHRKDLLERRLQILVCRGELQLTEAQANG